MEEKKKYSNEYVKHTFTEKEKKEISSEMALKVAQQKQLEDDKKAVTSDFGSRIEGAKAQINSAAVKLNNGYEYKTVKCAVSYDYDSQIVSFYRTDNGELGKERPMTQEETQGNLFEGEEQ